MIIPIHLDDFLHNDSPIIDVRSPSEFLQGHIPHSINIPLFSDQERAIIGTIYKQEGRIPAVQSALEIVSPQMGSLIHSFLALDSKSLRILCWRGGMRSGFVASLIQSLGLNPILLKGGYKSYRRWALMTIEKITQQSVNLCILGGLTGSGKTEILRLLQQLGSQVLDLEHLAAHRGSAFGSIKNLDQPTQEQFENTLAREWSDLLPSKTTWIEDEHRLIGKCFIPTGLNEKMNDAPIIVIQRSLGERIQHLLKQYQDTSNEHLFECTKKITKRLGLQLTNQVIHEIENENRQIAFEMLLSYYDRTYEYQLSKRKNTHLFNAQGLDFKECAHQLIALTKEIMK